MLLSNKSSHVALGGICAALSLLFLLIASVFPYCRLAFVFAASVIVGLLIVTKGIRLAAIQYIAVSLLALLFVPHKPIAVLYAVVVGNYPLLKRYIETIPNAMLKLIIKLILFNAYMGVCYMIAVFLLNINMMVAYSVWIMWIGILAVFFVYDYIYMLFVNKAYDLISKI